MAVASVRGNQDSGGAVVATSPAAHARRWMALGLALLLVTGAVIVESARAADDPQLLGSTPADCTLAVDPGTLTAYNASFDQAAAVDLRIEDAAGLAVYNATAPQPTDAPVEGQHGVSFDLTAVSLATASAFTAYLDVTTDDPATTVYEFETSFWTASDGLHLTAVVPAPCGVVEGDTLAQVTATFNEDVSTATVDLHAVGGLTPLATATSTATETAVTFAFDEPAALDPGTTYELHFSATSAAATPTSLEDFVTTFSTPAVAGTPTITWVPENGAVDVAVDEAVTATFPPDTAPHLAAIALTDGENSTVAGGSELVGGVTTFTPSEPLAYDTTYTATLTYTLEVDGTPDTDTVTFTTAADGTPTIVWTPENEAVEVEVDTAVTATFPTGTLPPAATIALTDVDGAIAGDPDLTGDVVTFTPTDDLDYDTTYTATLTYRLEADGDTATDAITFTTKEADPIALLNSYPKDAEADGYEDVDAEDLRVLWAQFTAPVQTGDVSLAPSDDLEATIDGLGTLDQPNEDIVRFFIDDEAKLDPGTSYTATYTVESQLGGAPATFAVTFQTTSGEQTIAFDPAEVDEVLLSEEELAVTATATSGLPVEVEVTDTDVCTADLTAKADGSALVTVDLLTPGTCELTATQAGDTRWAAAEATLEFEILAGVTIDPQITVTPRVFAPGEPFQVVGTGWDPDDQVRLELRSDPVLLGQVEVEDDGTFTVIYTAPDVLAGEHRVVATSLLDGTTMSGEAAVTLVSRIPVDDGSSPQPSDTTGTTTSTPASSTTTAVSLPQTGSDTVRLLLLGLALAVAGGLTVTRLRPARAPASQHGIRSTLPGRRRS